MVQDISKGTASRYIFIDVLHRIKGQALDFANLKHIDNIRVLELCYCQDFVLEAVPGLFVLVVWTDGL